MARIQLVDPKKAGLFVRLVFSIVRRKVSKLTGRAELVEPMRVNAHHPRIMWGFGQLDLAIEAGKSVPARYKQLAMLRVAKLVECPF